MKTLFAALLVAAVAIWAVPAEAKNDKDKKGPNYGNSMEHRQDGANRKGDRKAGAADAVMSGDSKAKKDKKEKKEKKEKNR